MDGRHYWEESGHPVKYENYNSNDGFGRPSDGQLNFATGGGQSDEDGDYAPGSYIKKSKISRQDPMSHRIIEKRRRDRMNNCLADLSRLIPPEYLKKGRGRVEKTEIIEMAIRHLKYLQERTKQHSLDKEHSDYGSERQMGAEDMAEHFRAGFQECVSESLRFLVDVQGYAPSDGLCVQLVSHLQRHYDHRTKGDQLCREKMHSHAGSSSEASSSSQSTGYDVKGVIRPTLPAQELTSSHSEPYDCDPSHEPKYSMDHDKVGDLSLGADSEPGGGGGRADYGDDYLHSYKFKNCIERRFSRSQDCEAHDMSVRKPHSHKRRRAASPPSASSASASAEEARASPPPPPPRPPDADRYVPIFALDADGKFYVPLRVEAQWLARAASAPPAPPPALHPVTIHVNYACARRP